MLAKVIEHSRPGNDYHVVPPHLAEGLHEIGYANRNTKQQAIEVPEERAGRRMQSERSRFNAVFVSRLFGVATDARYLGAWAGAPREVQQSRQRCFIS
jgi:hypothetical protein